MMEFLIFGFAFAATGAGVALIRRVGASSRLVDVPNDRSSHAIPTVRGGGLAIVLVCLGLYGALALIGPVTINWGFIIGAVMIGAVSYADDLFSLPALFRLIAHAAAAAILIAGSDIPDKLYLPVADNSIALGTVTYALFFIWIVWMINAFNFMDGIDGLAGTQGVAAGFGWVVLGIALGDPGLYLFGGVIGLSCLGFLIHNWSPAAIFMGDVGSAFLGYTLAAMPFLAEDHSRSSGWLFPAALTFLWLFLVDTIYTFSRRAVRGERVWIAHREHLYQRLVIDGASHSRVVFLYAALSILNSVAFFAAVRFRGTFDLLLLFSYLASALVVIAVAHRKKR